MKIILNKTTIYNPFQKNLIGYDVYTSDVPHSIYAKCTGLYLCMALLECCNVVGMIEPYGQYYNKNCADMCYNITQNRVYYGGGDTEPKTGDSVLFLFVNREKYPTLNWREEKKNYTSLYSTQDNGHPQFVIEYKDVESVESVEPEYDLDIDTVNNYFASIGSGIKITEISKRMPNDIHYVHFPENKPHISNAFFKRFPDSSRKYNNAIKRLDDMFVLMLSS